MSFDIIEVRPTSHNSVGYLPMPTGSDRVLIWAYGSWPLVQHIEKLLPDDKISSLWFGAKFSAAGSWITTRMEPKLDSFSDRTDALDRAADLGLQTWVSIGPYPDVLMSKMIELALQLAGSPWIILHKPLLPLWQANYPEAASVFFLENCEDQTTVEEWVRADHWDADVTKAKELLDAHGYRQSECPIRSGYWIHESATDRAVSHGTIREWLKFGKTLTPEEREEATRYALWAFREGVARPLKGHSRNERAQTPSDDVDD